MEEIKAAASITLTLIVRASMTANREADASQLLEKQSSGTAILQ